MNRNDDTPKATALDSLPSAAGSGVVPVQGTTGNEDGVVDHDPTLKWIVADGLAVLEQTPPPIPRTAGARTPPPILPVIAARQTSEPAATIQTPPLIVAGLADTRTAAAKNIAEEQTPRPEPKLSDMENARAARPEGTSPLVPVLRGATPADFLTADSTPPPPGPKTTSEGFGVAPAAALPETVSGEGELAADAVELLPTTMEETGQVPLVGTVLAVSHQKTAQVEIELRAPVPSQATEAPTEPREVEPEAVEMLEGPSSTTEGPNEPREVEPDAVEMVESAEHLTSSSIVDQRPAANVPPPSAAPPPVPTESPAAIPPHRPSAIAAALFDEFQTPSNIGDAIPEALARRSLKKRAKPWYEEIFDEDFLRTLPFMTPAQTAREVDFIRDALSVPAGGEVLDVGCGYGRHALELAQQGLQLTGLDLSLPMLIRAADHAQKRGLAVNFVHADMREMTYNGQFDAAYCVLSSFGYFDEETNLRVATAICRALKPGGRFLLDIINRDYIVGDLPSRVWWEGDGCVVLEEVDFNYHTSRALIRRSVVFGNGRQTEQEISLRAYSLHEVGKLLRQAGLRVLDVSGGLATRSKFYGASSRNIIAVCERPAP